MMTSIIALNGSSDVVYDDVIQQADVASTPLVSFSQKYQGYHGYVSAVVCVCGITLNIMNVVVLTRRTMRTPTNVLLTALAIADALTMLSYLPYALYFYCLTAPSSHYGHSRGWVVYLIVHTKFTITCHTAAMWLTVALATFRYVIVCRSSQSPIDRRHCSRHRATTIVVVIYVFTVLLSAAHYPMHLAALHRVQPDNGLVRLNDTEARGIATDQVELGSRSRPVRESGAVVWWIAENEAVVTPLYRRLCFWLFSVLLKVAPCCILVVLSALLISTMRAANRRRSTVLSFTRKSLARSAQDTLKSDDKPNGGSNRRKMSEVCVREGERAREHNRTTAMLIGVVMAFVATELPQGAVAFMAGVDERYFDEVYLPLADVWDALVLANSAVNFVLYCAMSRQFRDTFAAIFLGQKWRMVQQTSLLSASGSRAGGSERVRGPSPTPRLCAVTSLNATTTAHTAATAIAMDTTEPSTPTFHCFDDTFKVGANL